MFSPRIIITGAGPGGLALARLLHLRRVKSTILDLRSRPTPAQLRLPSGMLDLHEETGLAAIRACGLEKQFDAALGDCSEAVRIRTPDGKLRFSDAGETSTRPEVPRTSLIDILASSLPPNTIRWGTKVAVVSTEKTSESATEVVVNLADGEEVRADLVIGADGAWSKTRRQLTSSKPVYTGIQYLTATARYISGKYPHLADLCGTGASFALGGGHGIMTHRGPQDSLRVYIAIKTPEEKWAEKTGLKGQTADKAGEVILRDPALFADWAPELKEIIRVACAEDTKGGINAEADIKPIYNLPVDDAWASQPGLTVLGDAAHLMAPNGEGVNLALADALDLARLIGDVHPGRDAVQWQAAITGKIAEYEVIMRERAARSFEETTELLEIMHGKQGAEAMAQMFEGFGQGDGGEGGAADVEASKGS